MSQDLPRVSIILPVWNEEKTICSCLESLFSLTYPRGLFEIIVIDNRSTDRTVELARRFDVRLLSEPHIQSAYAARNRGIQAATGRIIAFTDSDCVTEPEWLTELVKGHEDQEYGCFVGEVDPYPSDSPVARYLDEYGSLRQKKFLDEIPMPYAVTANLAFRRKVFSEIGLFDQTMRSGGDNDICWRMQMQTSWKIRYNPRALVRHRYRENISGLCRQYYGYGQGISRLMTMYPSNFPNTEYPSRLAIARQVFITVTNVMIYQFCRVVKPLLREGHQGFRVACKRNYTSIKDLAYIFGLRIGE